MAFKLKNDIFRKARGGPSRLLLLLCKKCKEPVTLYQKDGVGILKRLYFDRIVSKNFLTQKNLVCKKCKTLLGVAGIYDKEARKIYRLFFGAIERKIANEDNIKRMG